MNSALKKLVSLCALGAAMMGGMTATAAIDKGIHVRISSTGTATYADGVTVKDGERFVLVWTAPGVTIDMTKDLSGDVNSFLGTGFCWIAMKKAKNGKCPATTVNITDTTYKTGNIQLYLLDTRVSETELAPLGTNKDGDSFPTVVNGAVPIGAAMASTTYWGTQTQTISGSAPATSAWVKSLLNPQPVILSLANVADVWTVGVTNTLSTHTYKLAKAYDVGFTNVVWRSDETDGATFVKSPLVIPDTDSSAPKSAAFYRIEVVK